MSDKFKGMTTVEFLYRYIFRGIGYVFLIGVITGLIWIGWRLIELHVLN